MKKTNITGLYPVIALACILSLTVLQNGFYLVEGFIVLVVLLSLSWRQYIPNVFTFILIYHWLQVISYIFYVNGSWGGDMTLQTDSSVQAYHCSMAGILVMAVIFNRVAYKKVIISKTEFEDTLKKIDPKKVLTLYLILYFISNILGTIAFSVSSLTQIFLNIGLLKWMGFVLLGYLMVSNKEYRKFFILAFALELVGGFISFFSSFKDVFFYSAIVGMTYVTRINLKYLFRGLCAAAVLFYFGLVWTIVKGDYRQFINAGNGQQVLVVTKGEAFTKFSDLFSGIDAGTLTEGVGQFFYRLQYVFNLSKAMDNVPSSIPFQDGEVWKQTITYVSVPRLLNPDKEVYSASLKASEYTGITYSGLDRGTSFSLGYFADCYIDFGIPGMFLAIAVIAFIWAKIYNFFLRKSSQNIVFNSAVASAFFIQFSYFEMDGTFMFGRLFSTFVVFLALKYTVFKSLEKYISF